MLIEEIEALIDPWRYAKEQRQLEGSLPLSRFAANEPVIPASTGDVRYQLCFGLDESGYCYIQGYIRTEYTLECQRCLRPLPHAVDAPFNLSPVQTEAQAKALPEQYEPVWLQEANRLSLLQLLTEELVLSLPIVPRHAEEACAGDGPDLAEPMAVKESPFAFLKDIQFREDIDIKGQ